MSSCIDHKDPAVKRVYRKLKLSRRKERMLVASAVIRIISKIGTPRRIRIGKKWIKARSGKVTHRAPVDLGLWDFYEWLKAEVHKDCGMDILDNEFQISKKASIEFQQGLERIYDTVTPEAKLIQNEEQKRLQAYLTQALSSLTPRELELIDCLTQGANPSQKLKISQSTVRAMRLNIRKKVPRY